MRRDSRFKLVLGLAVGAGLAFLLFLATRPVADEQVKLVANLAQLLAPSVAAASCAWAAASRSGRTRRAWALLAASAASWAVGQATWVWYEHLARRELPFPSLADVGYLGAIPLAGGHGGLSRPGREAAAPTRSASSRPARPHRASGATRVSRSSEAGGPSSAGAAPGWKRTPTATALARRRTGHGRVSGPARCSAGPEATRSITPSGTTQPGPPSP